MCCYLNGTDSFSFILWSIGMEVHNIILTTTTYLDAFACDRAVFAFLKMCYFTTMLIMI